MPAQFINNNAIQIFLGAALGFFIALAIGAGYDHAFLLICEL